MYPNCVGNTQLLILQVQGPPLPRLLSLFCDVHSQMNSLVLKMFEVLTEGCSTFIPYFKKNITIFS